MTATAAGSPAATELTGRFAAALARLLPEGGRPGLAVSGGTDSLAMLLLAAEAIPGGFEVATVDHGLRPEAADECDRVARICATLGAPCTVLRVSLAPGNLQAEARAARYRALGHWAGERGLAALLTAHQADDQAETLLMRLGRGSGLAGLAGIRERGAVPGTALPLIRPLLHVRRAELAALVAARGLTPVEDPSNGDARFDRVRIRQALAATPLVDPVALAASAGHLAEAAEALAWAAEREWGEQVSVAGGAVSYRPAAPRAIRLAIVERAIAMLGRPARGGDAARLLDALEAGGGGNAGGVLARSAGGEWCFAAEPPRSPPRAGSAVGAEMVGDGGADPEG